MAASGNISADAIERLTASALKLERAGGPAVAETVKQFESLGKAPVDASLKINETTRYLTTAVYEQIKALEDRGKTSEAAAVAQKARADAIDQRTPKWWKTSVISKGRGMGSKERLPTLSMLPRIGGVLPHPAKGRRRCIRRSARSKTAG